jgi:hypothetical protein
MVDDDLRPGKVRGSGPNSTGAVEEYRVGRLGWQVR